MRFSSVTVLSVVAVLASSISATPIDAAPNKCPWTCQSDSDCSDCYYRFCASISSFPEFDTRLTCTTGLVSLQILDAQIASDRSTCIKKVSAQLLHSWREFFVQLGNVRVSALRKVLHFTFAASDVSRDPARLWSADWFGRGDSHSQEDFDWLVDYIGFIYSFDHEAAYDILLLLGSMGVCCSPAKRHLFIKRLIACMDSNMPLPLRHAALRAAHSAREQIASIDDIDDPTLRDIVLTELSPAILTQMMLSKDMNSPSWSVVACSDETATRRPLSRAMTSEKCSTMEVSGMMKDKYPMPTDANSGPYKYHTLISYATNKA
ncbi:uncharacterized protein F5147DRAFT_757156 [Suillus discolor]|uniref:Uncharacterized protein n=1 Tax=Suillus discolor TaxID=1912936 RepID=A0A9P7JZ94_9AGAM|nr:uncharacterized protein F5147DRAFT_757156 [Suillus discolor]KAG2118654.1 hypothetical protein F5147DRAFT_757156 [Suillus discolor]